MKNPSAEFRSIRRASIRAACLVFLLAGSARASIAYGSINNFDTVNDTGSECHGFEIEIEDCRSTDISYTYDYNHYGDAKATNVGADVIHGDGIKIINGVEADLSTVIVVGEYKGAQMAAVDVEGGVGLIDHLSDRETGVPYTARRMVVEGPLPFTATREGALPAGMEFDLLTGILSGTPTQSGEFPISVTVDDGTNPALTRNYVLMIAEAGQELPPSYVVDPLPQPLEAGTTMGNGSFAPGSEVTVQATPVSGYHFVNWTDHGVIVGTSSSHTFNIGEVNRSLVAHFEVADAPTPIELKPSITPGIAFAMEWSLVPSGWMLEESPSLTPGSWTNSNRPDTPHDGLHHVEIPSPVPPHLFFRLKKP